MRMLLDANIFMYAAGSSHENKAPSAALLRRVASGDVDAVCDAEVFQEILHRYRAIRRWEDGRRVYDSARLIVPVVLDVTVEIVDRARNILDGVERLSPRDALHAAVALHHDIPRICSYDRDFDLVPEITRVDPGGA